MAAQLAGRDTGRRCGGARAWQRRYRDRRRDRTVGRRVLELIEARRALLQRSGVRLRIVAAANSRRLLVVPDGLAAGRVAELLPDAAASTDPLALTRSPLRPDILLDCTASADITAQYPRWLAAGIDIVTPNKLASSADRPLAHAVAAAQAASGTHLYDSTTVGAQPPLATLRDLHRAGDRVERLKRCCRERCVLRARRLQQGCALDRRREAVQTACRANPARDLSGEDAARKLVILRALATIWNRGRRLRPAGRWPCSTGRIRRWFWRGWNRRMPAGARAAVADVRHERWVYRASYEDGHARIAPERVAQRIHSSASRRAKTR
jgi:aspartokinase/homoserine dehydrogenase 1